MPYRHAARHLTSSEYSPGVGSRPGCGSGRTELFIFLGLLRLPLLLGRQLLLVLEGDL